MATMKENTVIYGPKNGVKLSEVNFNRMRKAIVGEIGNHSSINAAMTEAKKAVDAAQNDKKVKADAAVKVGIVSGDLCLRVKGGKELTTKLIKNYDKLLKSLETDNGGLDDKTRKDFIEAVGAEIRNQVYAEDLTQRLKDGQGQLKDKSQKGLTNAEKMFYKVETSLNRARMLLNKPNEVIKQIAATRFKSVDYNLIKKIPMGEYKPVIQAEAKKVRDLEKALQKSLDDLEKLRGKLGEGGATDSDRFALHRVETASNKLIRTLESYLPEMKKAEKKALEIVNLCDGMDTMNESQAGSLMDAVQKWNGVSAKIYDDAARDQEPQRKKRDDFDVSDLGPKDKEVAYKYQLRGMRTINRLKESRDLIVDRLGEVCTIVSKKCPSKATDAKGLKRTIKPPKDYM